MFMTTRTASIVASCLGLVAVAATPARAPDTHFKFYGGAAYVAPLSESDITVGSVTDAVKAQQQVGWNFGIEGRFNKWLGLEVDYDKATQDVDYGGQTIGKTDFSPLTASLNIHVVHTTVVDFYLGPSYSYVNWGDIEFNQAGQGIFSTNGQGTDSDNAWGIGLGLDIGFGKHFALTGGLRYLDTNLTLSGGPKIAVNPLVGRLGVAVRF
jgi:hypothetical protein